jgi:hypothetical protein
VVVVTGPQGAISRYELRVTLRPRQN